MIKSYTDVQQGRKLAEFLPLESADMRYAPFGDTHPWFIEDSLIEKDSIPCWSLAALFDTLPKAIGSYSKMMGYFDGAYHCDYIDEDGECLGNGTTADTLIDAVYKMVLKQNNPK